MKRLQSRVREQKNKHTMIQQINKDTAFKKRSRKHDTQETGI